MLRLTPTAARPRVRRPLAAGLAALALLAAACGDDEGTTTPDAGAAPTSTTAEPADDDDGGNATTAPTATDEPAPEPIPALALAEVATLDQPVALATRPGDDAGLYVVQQTGQVVRIEIGGDEAGDPTYTVADELVLDIADEVVAGGEQGLLGLAFSADGAEAYVAHTGLDEDQYLAAYPMTGDVADAAGRRELLVVPDFASNHNGGQLALGPDGYLYWSMGDGGGGGDPEQHGQDPSTLLGTIMRIDPAGGDPYAVPADNPFVDGGGAPEVWSYGLRNPWRFSFDRDTGDLWIADVGQGEVEEIDLVRAADGAGRGANFGWSEMEGDQPFEGGTEPEGAVGPVFTYGHTDGRCSVTGGYVYRGGAVPGLAGTYLYADFCQGGVRGLQVGDEGAVVDVDLGLSVPSITSFGEGPSGEVYTLSIEGPVSRIVVG